MATELTRDLLDELIRRTEICERSGMGSPMDAPETLRLLRVVQGLVALGPEMDEAIEIGSVEQKARVLRQVRALIGDGE